VTHKQETGKKESLNLITLTNFSKSAFWFYYFVHLSSKWYFCRVYSNVNMCYPFLSTCLIFLLKIWIPF